MRMLALTLAAGCLALAGCGDRASPSVAVGGVQQEAAIPPPMAPPPPPAPVTLYRAADLAQQGSPSRQQVTGNPQAQGQATQQIAYTYEYAFAIATMRMQELMDAQKAACQQAGSAKCYILSSSISGIGEDSASGQMQMKASPDWIKEFQTGLPASLKSFSARIDSTNTEAEDLSTQIIDTTAHLNSNKTLRDRLQALLKDRPGKLGDLLDIERELARVQGDIDSTESVLAAMKLRVAMSTLTLSYKGEYSAVSESIWRPLGDAFKAFLPNIVGSLAWIVEVVSNLLIWIVLVAGLVLFFWTRGKRKRAARAAAASPPAAKTG